jgi:hypothetical protein
MRAYINVADIEDFRGTRTIAPNRLESSAVIVEGPVFESAVRQQRIGVFFPSIRRKWVLNEIGCWKVFGAGRSIRFSERGKLAPLPSIGKTRPISVYANCNRL